MVNDFFLTEWFFYLVRWLYSVLGNSYFLTILIVTLLLRAVQIFPDIKSRKSQRQQAALQPEIEKLQERYANNPQKLQQEQSKLMKENGVSMLAGCLPMLLTLPIFFSFLAAFRFWGYEQTIKLTYETITQPTQAEETYDSFRFLWITNVWQPDSIFSPVVPTAQNVKSYPKLENLVIFRKGYTKLNGEKVEGEEIWNVFCEEGLAKGQFETDSMSMLPTDEAQKAYDELMGQYKHGYNNGWCVLPILAAVFQFLSAWISQKQTQKYNPAAAKQQKQMNFMMWLFPLMSIWFCMTSTSAFALYWVFSSMIQIATGTVINWAMNKESGKEKIAK